MFFITMDTKEKTQPTQVLGWSRDAKGNIVNRHPVSVANTVTANKRNNTQNYVREPKCEVVGKLEGGKWDKSLDIMKRVYGENGLAPTQHCVGGGNMECKVQTGYRIRKLTPRECFRLMGVGEPQIDTLLSAGISNSQLYKLAGNSIVVDVLCGIFRKMFIDTANENQQMTLF